MYGADRLVVAELFVAQGSSPHTRGRSSFLWCHDHRIRFIPVYTGQIHKELLQNPVLPVHPRIHGADTKFPKKIPATEGWLLPPQNSMAESVCIIFWECIFADNTFRSFLMFFSQKRDANGIPFSICPLVMIFFFVCTLPGFCTLPMSCLSLCSNTIPYVHCSRIIGRMDSFLRACLLRTS